MRLIATKKTDESDAQKVIRKALNSAGQGGEDGEAMFFVDLERVYQLLIYLSAAAVASTATSTATLPRLDLLTKFIKLWAKMQATHSCLDNVARANVASLIKIKTTLNTHIVEADKGQQQKKDICGVYKRKCFFFLHQRNKRVAGPRASCL